MKDLWMFVRRFTRPYKGTLALSVLFNIITAIFTIFSFAFLIPILQMLFGLETGHYSFMEWSAGNLKEVVINNFYYFTEELIRSHGQSFTLAFLAGILIVMTILKTGTYFLSDYFIIPLRNGVVRDIRNTMYAKILSLPIGFFTMEHKGDIMARLSGDVSEVENSVLASILSVIRYPIMIIVCLAVMIYISWQLTVFVFILLPVVGAVMGYAGKKLKVTSRRGQDLWGIILSTTEETIGGLRVVKAFNAENDMKRRFGRETAEYLAINNAVQRRVALAHPMSETLGTIAIALVLWFGGSLILSGHSSIDAAEFIYYMVIFYSVINPAKELSRSGYTIQKGMAALQRIDVILDAENPIADPVDPAGLPEEADRKGNIELRDVSFSYDGEHDVLRDVSLYVAPGETVAIVGQSGSGKSTLVDLIPRFWDVQKGEVLVDGVDVRRLRVHDLRSLMGNVNQEAILFNDTFYNNIAFGKPDATREEVEQAARIANAHDFIMATPDGYDTVVGDRGSRLSGGQRQRISIARAILKNPPVLILDEATSALDTESERLVQEALERLMRDRTTIVIAHRLSTITNADKICVMHEGEIIEQGTHSELMALGGHYHRLVQLQSADAPTSPKS
ncbi:MAG: ABC transporter ATP-binding protein/permease [Muribaculaceae bacterium]|nr:ABC transporter ATP-binding protein/permease [Muribaculaceae bacterium]